MIAEDEHTEPSVGIIRQADRRPSWRQVAWRSLAVFVVTALALWVLAAILEGFTIDTRANALLAGFVVGVANAAIWPSRRRRVLDVDLDRRWAGRADHRDHDPARAR